MEDLLVEDGNVTLTIRLIMQGKEVGSIIGKKGEIVKRFREESGAKINISDGSCPERIVTVSGTTKAIYKAFLRITKKFEEWCSQFSDSPGGKTQIPIRLIVPASQCGSLIGKGGSKIKEIRELTGCSIQVASEMLPNSTERAVTLNGSAEQITQCIFQICNVMLESPPKGATIPYRPKPQVNGPVILANGQAYTIQGNFALPTQERCAIYSIAMPGGGHATTTGHSESHLKGAHLTAAVAPHHHHLQLLHDIAGLTKNPLAGLAAVGLAGMAPSNTSGINPVALAALAGSQLRSTNPTRTQQTNTQQQEMTVPNDLIGCIIGKGGTKIAEIRQISGAMIRISNCEEREAGNTDRTITISGNPDAVAVAQYLINMSVELQKQNLTDGPNQTSSPSSTTSNTNLSVAAAAAAAAQAAANAAANNGTSGSASGVGGDVASMLANANGNAAAVAAAAALGLTNGGVATTVSQSPQSLTSSMSNTNASSTSSSPGQTMGQTPAALAPLAQLLAKPGAINALNSITALSGLQDFLGGLAGIGASGCGVGSAGGAGPPQIQTTGVHRMPKGNGNGLGGLSVPRMRHVTAGNSLAAAAMNANGNSLGGDKKNDRNKFNPY